VLKKLLFTVVLIAVLVVGGGIFYLDSLARRAIEVAGSRALQTEVTVESVSLSPLSGKGSISAMVVANPAGFSAANAFELGEISVALNLRSLGSEQIEVESIIIDSPLITYENMGRSDNLSTLLGNIERQDNAGETEPGAAAAPELIIRDFRILNPRLDLITPVVSAPVVIEDIILTDIGTGANAGATVKQVSRLLLTRIRRAILESNMPQVEDYRQGLRLRMQELETEARDVIDGAVEDLGSRLQDALNAR